MVSDEWTMFVFSVLACVASVSMGLGAKKDLKDGDFRCFACVKNGVGARKKTKWGEVGEVSFPIPQKFLLCRLSWYSMTGTSIAN